jgi:predicted nucleic acid-binding protein
VPRAVRERARPRARLELLFDTNVLLDVMLDRSPWADDATRLLDRVATGAARGFVAAHAVTTLQYIVQRARGRAVAVTAMSDLLELLDVVPLDSADFQRALALQLKDFEDAVQVAACLRAGADFLVTRNPRDFAGAPVELRSAGEIAAMLGNT